MDPEVSVTSTTEARSTGTATVASGRARASTSAPRASASSAGGTRRRQALCVGRIAASVGVAGKRTTYRAGRRRARTRAARASGTTASPSRNSGDWKLMRRSGAERTDGRPAAAGTARTGGSSQAPPEVAQPVAVRGHDDVPRPDAPQRGRHLVAAAQFGRGEAPAQRLARRVRLGPCTALRIDQDEVADV